MSSMNLATQKRTGTLPRSEDILTYPGHIYGNTHRGFGMRRPAPIASTHSKTSPGFFGLGNVNDMGDGKMHYYGNDEGQANLPRAGFYGFSGDMDYQAGQMLIADPAENLPTNPPGIYGAGDTIKEYATPRNIGIAAVVLFAYMKYK
tara:strand:+ start:68 stop:508 length:441 start_codon:yes stop_codon:yes gene_type:complete